MRERGKRCIVCNRNATKTNCYTTGFTGYLSSQPKLPARGAFPSVSPAPRHGLVQYLNGHFHRRRSVVPELERLDPRQRKRFVIVAMAGWQADGMTRMTQTGL